MYNLSGGVASTNGGAVPTGYIASGQGFFIDAEDSGTVTFNNSMRAASYANDNFYRQAAGRERIWLSLSHLSGWFSQQLLAFSPQATDEYDRGYDGRVNATDNILSFYSLIGDTPYRIQGRKPFDAYQQVPLGFRAMHAGTYQIAIDQLQGAAMTNPEQPVFLEDLHSGTLHNLKSGSYEFSTAAGVFNGRFVLRFAGTELSAPEFAERDVRIVATDERIQIRASQEISSVEIYDITGRSVFKRNAVSSLVFDSGTLRLSGRVALVFIRFSDGGQLVKKAVF